MNQSQSSVFLKSFIFTDSQKKKDPNDQNILNINFEHDLIIE